MLINVRKQIQLLASNFAADEMPAGSDNTMPEPSSLEAKLKPHHSIIKNWHQMLEDAQDGEVNTTTQADICGTQLARAVTHWAILLVGGPKAVLRNLCGTELAFKS